MFDFEKISASKFYVAPSVERVVDFSPPDIDMENVAKILSLAVDAKCVSVDVFDGYVNLDGRTNFRLTYLDKDGTPKGLDYNADFSMRVDGEFLDGDTAECEIHVVETDVQASDTLRLSAVLEVKVCAIRRDELDVLVGADDCYKTMKEVYVPKFLAMKTSTAPFDDEQNVGAEVSSVLSVSASCIVKDVRAVDGGMTAKASVFATVTYMEGSEIKQRDFEIPLEEEFALDGVADADTIKIVANIKSSKVILQGVTDDNVIRLEGEVQYKVWAFRCQKESIVGDVFMLTNEIKVDTKKAQYTCFDGCGFFTERVSGTAVLGDNKAPAREVSALPYARCYTTRAYVGDDGKLEVEGVVNTDIIYTDENGYNSVRAEIPFALSIESETPLSKVVKVNCKVQQISATARREREFDIALTLSIEVCGFSPLEFDYISAVEVGQEREQNTSGLSIYIADEGDSMLDVCKALTALPDDVLLQNPNLQLPLKEGDRVLYFRQLV